MGMSKSIKVIVSLVFVVFLALAATNIEAARYIEYPSLLREITLSIVMELTLRNAREKKPILTTEDAR